MARTALFVFFYALILLVLHLGSFGPALAALGG